MNTAHYDTRPYICPTPRFGDFHDVASWALWVPTVGAAVSSGKSYLDADAPDGEITLGCGIEEMASDLGAAGWLFALGEDHITRICECVDIQLRRQAWAALRCPQGKLLIQLVKWERR
ncbi:MAG: hypothetical protein KDB70_04935 [Mycobacterium sp.]|nr:hypothetical protein [Mycobacterium sp.]